MDDGIEFISVARKIMEVALKIEEAVETVRQNERECREVARCAARVGVLLERLDHTPTTETTMKDPAVSGPLEDLAESVEKALELVNECHCQQEHATFLRRLWSADDMARELRQVQEDIGRKLQLGTFALMVAGEGRRRRSKMMAGKDDDDGPAIGIDLGTTYSCVGLCQHGRVVIVASEQGDQTTPSCVAFTDSERLVGDPAKNQVARNTSNTVFGECRLLCHVNSLSFLACTPRFRFVDLVGEDNKGIGTDCCNACLLLLKKMTFRLLHI